jgi:hypothetical protein
MEAVQIYLHAHPWEDGVKFYTTLLGRAPDSTPDYGVAEWELVPKCTLVVGGNPGERTHLSVEIDNLKDVHDRVKNGLALEPEGDLWRYGTTGFSYKDPWGNTLFFYSKQRWSAASS